jgi:hypothetical protein
MKPSGRRLQNRPLKNRHIEAFSLSYAKTFLGRLLEKAGKGETVYIIRGERRFIVQEVPPIDPIPIRPAGYFDDCYTSGDTEELNALGKDSVLAPPDDLD